MSRKVVRKLRQYYQDQGIAADDFRCPHHEECSAESGDAFVTAREPGVGEEYLARSLPRLCFVSLDAGKLEEPTKLWVREEPADVDQWPANQHWHQTHVLASELLGVFDPDMTPGDAALHFAHANAVRCCENRSGRSQARWELYKNCQPYLRRELELLAPDIVVTQGNGAKWSVRTSFADDVKAHSRGGVEYWRLPIGERGQALWFHMYHPRYGGYWSQKEEHLPVFREVLRQEMPGAATA